jgi:hypothetical protein
LLDELIDRRGDCRAEPPRRRQAARFIEEAKKDGTVRRALDSAGFVDRGGGARAR